MINFFSRFAWQVGAGAAVIALLTVSGFLVAASVENTRISAINRELDARITDPRTGYVVRLAQAQTNAATVTAGLKRQVQALQDKAALDAERLAETERLLAAAQGESRVARQRAAALTARAPVGDTLEQRVLDVDGKILETLR